MYQPDQRLLRGRTATIQATHTDGLGVLVASLAGGSVIVTNSLGDVIATSGFDFDTAIYSATIEIPDLLDRLTAVWTTALGDTWSTKIEVVGGHGFDLIEARGTTERPRIPAANYPDSIVITQRIATELEAERICYPTIFVPRYASHSTLGDSSNKVLLPTVPTAVRSVTIDAVALTATQLAAITIQESTLYLSVLAERDKPIQVVYETGFDRCPTSIRDAMVERTWYKLRDNDHPTKAARIEQGNGDTIEIATEGPDLTGLTTVDAAYAVYRPSEDNDGAGAPASGILEYDPQYDSIFHGGRR